jgi:hypothetical protein
MAIFGSQTPHESSVSGKVKCTPLQGTDYAKRCASDPPSPNYRNLDQWLREVSTGYPSHLQKSGDHLVRPRQFATILIKGLFPFAECSAGGHW